MVALETINQFNKHLNALTSPTRRNHELLENQRPVHMQEANKARLYEVCDRAVNSVPEYIVQDAMWMNELVTGDEAKFVMQVLVEHFAAAYPHNPAQCLSVALVLHSYGAHIVPAISDHPQAAVVMDSALQLVFLPNMAERTYELLVDVLGMVTDTYYPEIWNTTLIAALCDKLRDAEPFNVLKAASMLYRVFHRYLVLNDSNEARLEVRDRCMPTVQPLLSALDRAVSMAGQQAEVSAEIIGTTAKVLRTLSSYDLTESLAERVNTLVATLLQVTYDATQLPGENFIIMARRVLSLCVVWCDKYSSDVSQSFDTLFAYGCAFARHPSDGVAAKGLDLIAVVAKRSIRTVQASTTLSEAGVGGVVTDIVLPALRTSAADAERHQNTPLEVIRTLCTHGAMTSVRRSAANTLLTELSGKATNATVEATHAELNRIQARLAEATDEQKCTELGSAYRLYAAVAGRNYSAGCGYTAFEARMQAPCQFAGFAVTAVVDFRSVLNCGVYGLLWLCDALAFLYNFRSQLTAQQLLAVVEGTSNLLGACNDLVVTSTASLLLSGALTAQTRDGFLVESVDEFATTVFASLQRVLGCGDARSTLSSVATAMLTLVQRMSPQLRAVIDGSTVLGLVQPLVTTATDIEFATSIISTMCEVVSAKADGATLSEADTAVFDVYFDVCLSILGGSNEGLKPLALQALAVIAVFRSTVALPPAVGEIVGRLLSPAEWVRADVVPSYSAFLSVMFAKYTSLVATEGNVRAALNCFKKSLNQRASFASACGLVATIAAVAYEHIHPRLVPLCTIMAKMLGPDRSPLTNSAFGFAVTPLLMVLVTRLGVDAFRQLKVKGAVIGDSLLDTALRNVGKAQFKDSFPIIPGLLAITSYFEGSLESTAIVEKCVTALSRLVSGQGTQRRIAKEHLITVLENALPKPLFDPAVSQEAFALLQRFGVAVQ